MIGSGTDRRLVGGAYRAKASRRVWIPKPDGRQRPLGIASLEDKIVQQAVLWVLQSIYEQDFLGFSYGFRPGRSQHDALDALSVAMTSKKVNWILDADIEGFFDNIDHEWLIKFLEPTNLRSVPDRRPTHSSAGTQMAAGRRQRRRRVVQNDGRSASGGGDLTALVKRVPALCL